MSDPQYPCHNGEWNYAALGMSQPGDPFSSTPFSGGFMGSVHEGLQPGVDRYEMNPAGIKPSDLFSMDPFPFPNTPGMLNMNGAQLEPAFHSTTVPAPISVTAPAANDDSIRCTRCGVTFGRGEELRRHMGKHRSPKWRCNFVDCDKTFYRADKLRDHLRKGHKGALSFLL